MPADDEYRGAARQRSAPGHFMLTLDHRGRIERAAGLGGTLGHDDGAWLGRSARRLLAPGPSRRQLVVAMRAGLTGHGSWSSVQHCLAADGELVEVRIFVTLRHAGDTDHRAGCFVSGILAPDLRDRSRSTPTAIAEMA